MPMTASIVFCKVLVEKAEYCICLRESKVITPNDLSFSFDSLAFLAFMSESGSNGLLLAKPKQKNLEHYPFTFSELLCG